MKWERKIWKGRERDGKREEEEKREGGTGSGVGNISGI